MALNLEDVLKQLGWSDGFQIPIANAENKILEEELAKLSFRKQRGRTNLDVVSARLNAINDHLKFVNQESDQTQKLINTHKEQLETLEHVFCNTRTDNRNAQHAFKMSVQQLKEAEYAQNEKKTELQKLIMKADKLKAEMDWDSEALKAWDEALKKRDEDIELLRKFFKDDDRKFNQLEARRQHLKAELVSVQEKIEKIASNYHNAEQMVERSGKVIKQLSNEREALINQWKNTVGMLQQRDSDIMRAQEDLGHVNEVLQKAEDKLNTEKKFLANEKKNNKELEMEILEANDISTRYRKELADLYHYLMTNQTAMLPSNEQKSSPAKCKNKLALW